MANHTIAFHGAPTERVIIIFQERSLRTFTAHDLDFVKTKFNTLRNYRDFTNPKNVTVIERHSNNLPRVSSLKDGDAILLVGYGRFIDQKCYEYALSCINNNIPVYFIRSNSLEFDPRACSYWKTASLTVKTATGKKHYGPPDKFFMEIPRMQDLILSKFTEDYYALLPGMVPM